MEYGPLGSNIIIRHRWVYVIFFAWSLTPTSTSYTTWVVFGGIMMSGFVVHGIGFFGPWFSNSSIGIRVS